MQGNNDWRCFVCEGEMAPYFLKDFDGVVGLGIVDYWRCSNCGIVFSKTHFEMAQDEWELLNHRYHGLLFGRMQNPDDPRWRNRLHAQASNIRKLVCADVLPKNKPWIDWGCGDGKLANDLFGQKDIPVLKYDKYMGAADGNSGYLKDEELIPAGYDVVICTSVFEHVRSIDTLDEIVGLVGKTGVLALHVMVREEIPQDPTWSYLLPTHCTFFTNKSMQILFDHRWGFESSIYYPKSRMWFWFKENPKHFPSDLNNEYHFKRGFMDFWKNPSIQQEKT